MRILIKFTEVNEYSLFTPYEFGGKLLWVHIVDGFYFIDIVDYITSYGIGTILYFEDPIKHIVRPNEFYTVSVYLSDTYWNACMLHSLQII